MKDIKLGNQLYVDAFLEKKFILLLGAGIESSHFGTYTVVKNGKSFYRKSEEMTFPNDLASTIKAIKHFCSLKLKEKKALESGCLEYTMIEEIAKAGLVSHILTMNISGLVDSHQMLNKITTYVHGI